MTIRFPHQMPEPEDGLMSSINTTPLVDVMLVLLIIFLITIPVVNSSIAVNLPRESAQASEAQPQAVGVGEPVVTSGAMELFSALHKPDTPQAGVAVSTEARQ